jgi:hypothetical protein
LVIVTHTVNVPFGDTVQLTGGAASGFSYNWFSNGVPVVNADTSILTISNVTMNAVYDVVPVDPCGQAWPPEFFNINVIPKNTVGRWFSGAQTLADVSGYQPAGTHDGYDIGNPGGGYYFTNDVPPGRSGYSLYLTNDGIFITNSSIVDAAYTNTFDDTIRTAMTVAFWAKGSPGIWNPWVSKYGNSSGWQLRRGAQNILWTMQGTGTACAVPVGTLPYGNSADLAGTNVLNDDGKWHSYVGTYNSSVGIRSLYVDGVLSAKSTCNEPYALAPFEHLCIGAKDSGGDDNFGSFYTGEIYDVRIASYDWDANDVANYSGAPRLPMPIQSSNKFVLIWNNGTLEQATSPLGPWIPTGAASPYTNDPSTAPKMFFRLSFP